MKTFAFLLFILAAFLPSCEVTTLESDTVAIGIDADPTNLDPRLATDANSSRIIGLLFSGLVRQDEKGLLRPDLAASWDMEAPTTYLFHLRRDVRFHDGTPLTSKDVKYTIETILDPATASPHRSTFEKIERIETPDVHTVRFVLTEPFAPFLLAMTMGVVPREAALAAGDEFSITPVGSGPFRLTERRPGEIYRLKAYPHYFGGRPKLAQVLFRVVPDNTVRFLEMRKGTLNLLINGIELDYIPLVQKDPRLKLVTGPGVNYSYIGFNLLDPILRAQAVREAISHAVDREAVIQHLLKGTGQLATGLLSPLNWAYNNNVTTYRYDP
ncbi:MAG: ABC transporter substrate-binding protein, partial [bacterium]|nr:ABC transporter substrate-binding protein [bacterium]